MVVRHIKQKGEDVQQVADCCHSKACKQHQHVSGAQQWSLGKLRSMQLWLGHCLCATPVTAPGSEEIHESTLTQSVHWRSLVQEPLGLLSLSLISQSPIGQTTLESRKACS